jgi:hypothetical protein
MQIQFGSEILATSATNGPSGLTINGALVTDEAQLFRAIANTIYARGNKKTELSFTVWNVFNTRGLAESFIVSHWSGLAASDILSITCGDGEATQYVYQMAGTVADPVAVEEWRGLSVRVRYRFTGGLFTTESSAPTNESSLIKRGIVALTTGDTSKAVAFAAAFGAKPVVQIQVQKPTSADDAVADWGADDADISDSGFTARGQPIPASGYVLNWVAVSVT